MEFVKIVMLSIYLLQIPCFLLGDLKLLLVFFRPQIKWKTILFVVINLKIAITKGWAVGKDLFLLNELLSLFNWRDKYIFNFQQDSLKDSKTKYLPRLLLQLACEEEVRDKASGTNVMGGFWRGGFRREWEYYFQ